MTTEDIIQYFIRSKIDEMKQTSNKYRKNIIKIFEYETVAMYLTL